MSAAPRSAARSQPVFFASFRAASSWVRGVRVVSPRMLQAFQSFVAYTYSTNI